MSSMSPRPFRRHAPLVMLLAAAATRLGAADAPSDYWVRVMPSAWFSNLSGETNYSAGGTPGDHLSLESLDLANQQAGFGLEISAKLPILFSFHAGGFVVGTDGSFSTPAIRFGGQTISGAVNSSLDLRDVFAEADLQILDLDVFGFAIGVGYHDLNAKVELSSSGSSAKLDEDLSFPVVALRAHTNIPVLASLGAEAKVHWMEISVDHNSVAYVDASLQVTWMPWRMLGFMGGYRYVSTNLHFDQPAGSNSEAKVDVSLAGPFLGLTAQF